MIPWIKRSIQPVLMIENKLIYFALILLIIILSREGEARDNIRVLIMENTPSATIESPWGFDLPQGMISNRIDIDKEGIKYNPLRITPIGDYLTLNGKRYRGSIEVRKGEKGIYIINDLNIEDYLKGVVPQEMDHKWDMEALKAQAIVARTYARYYMKENKGREYDLESSILSQVYNGMDGERFGTTVAVMETEGIILTYEGKPIEAFYHASCGGRTENSGDVWAKDAPYLRGVECTEISQSWEREMTLGEIETALRKEGVIKGSIIKLEVGSTTNTGRVSYLKVSVNNGNSRENIYIRGNDFRKTIGYTRIPSTYFRMVVNGAGVKFLGKGAGHGVGFCQFGAKEMAERGKNFKEILRHYYRGVEIGNNRDL
ncbi:MAG: SpoIID/LytB domain-containing protein [Nitrospirae bacterium]|nr:SpoIID/LytB domain-containing protein [Nitrospirota bacterium]